MLKNRFYSQWDELFCGITRKNVSIQMKSHSQLRDWKPEWPVTTGRKQPFSWIRSFENIVFTIDCRIIISHERGAKTVVTGCFKRCCVIHPLCAKCCVWRTHEADVNHGMQTSGLNITYMYSFRDKAPCEIIHLRGTSVFLVDESCIWSQLAVCIDYKRTIWAKCLHLGHFSNIWRKLKLNWHVLLYLRLT